MIITDLVVQKMDPADPRYPDPPEGRSITAVYRIECTLEDGQQFEACHMFFKGGTGLFGEKLTPDHAQAMLMSFGNAIGHMAEKAAA